MTTIDPQTPHFEKIMQALNIDTLTPEEQEMVLTDIGELIFKGTMVRLVEKMNEATRDEFSALVATGANEEALETFIAEHVPDSNDAVAATVEEITNDILAVTKAS